MKGHIYTCYYCKLKHPKVEAAGIFHCPNKLCTGPGAAYFRRTLQSYKENSDGTHFVDNKEIVHVATGWAHADCDDAVISKKILNSVKAWK